MANLTPQQEMAASNQGGKLLVSAAAGSGKTMVLVERVLRRLLDPQNPAQLDDFLMITYTKAAAQELRGKIASKLTERIAENPENRHLQRQLQRLYLTKISTVHGFCSDILRDYAYQLDLSGDFRVADENECREYRSQALSDLLDTLYETQGDNPDFCAFVDTQGYGRNDSRIEELVNQVYNSARCHLNPDAWLDRCVKDVELPADYDAAQTAWGAYLLDRLRKTLQEWIPVLKRCANQAAQWKTLSKAAAYFDGLIHSFQYLQTSQTWNEAHERNIDWGRFPAIRKAEDPALLAQLQAVKDEVKKAVTDEYAPFSVNSAAVMEKVNRCAPSCRGLIDLVREFGKAYAQVKRSHHVLDFGDLEHKTLDLLTGKGRNQVTTAAKEIGARFREVMVDEYQDSNQVQDAIFNAITHERQNLFLVGDVKQSIYSFRLADPGIFLEKYNSFLPAETAEAGQGRKVLLCDNFRSGGEVISAVNAVFRGCMSRQVGGLDYTDAEALREGGSGHTPLPDSGVEFYALETEGDKEKQEAEFAAARIQEMLLQQTLVRDGSGLRPVKPEDIVILLRSVKTRATVYQNALEQLGIPCSTDAGENLLRTDEISTFRALLQTIANPQQDIPLLSVLASPIFGFTADELAKIRGGRTKVSFFDALQNSREKKAEAFLQVLAQLRREASMSPLTVLLERCFTLTRLDSIYAAMPGGQVRQENLRSFFSLAAAYEDGNSRTLGQFLDYLQMLEEQGLTGASADRGGVTVMSIHKSKGLEFPVVFLCDMSREFNNASQREAILCDQDLGVGLYSVDLQQRARTSSALRQTIAAKISERSISEEMRVLYVAMTRAKDRLIMTYAKNEKRLAGQIERYANLIPMVGRKLLCETVSSPGDWVLLTALGRTEAGKLISGLDAMLSAEVSDIPWKIDYLKLDTEAVQSAHAAESQVPETNNDFRETLERALSFSYSYDAATAAPSKQTATGRKGRQKDEESAENSPQPVEYRKTWRTAKFAGTLPEGREYGIAMHGAMQYLNFSMCGTHQGLLRELDRLVETERIRPEQRGMISEDQLEAFFHTPLGMRLVNGENCIREFKFSILEEQEGTLSGEQVLLQGVVDCALIEPDWLTILDFKTDRVKPETLSRAVGEYSPQVQTYARALSRIFEKPVKASFLYFFRLNQLVPVEEK